MAQPCEPAPQGLVSWWRAENNAGDSASTNNGTLQGGATYAAGKAGFGFSLNGVDADVMVPDSTSLALSTFTLECWAKVSDTTQDRAILVKSAFSALTGNEFAYGMRVLNGGQLEGRITSSGGTAVSVVATSALAANLFYHLAFTCDGSALKLYVNGVPDGTTATALTPVQNTEPVLIGAWASSTAGVIQRWFGLLDEVSIYNRALAGSEVQALFQAGSAGKCELARLTGVAATALTGAPGNTNQPSANPGQAVTLTGTNLSTAAPVFVSYTDSNGVLLTHSVNPTTAALDGSSATVLLPDYLNGVAGLTAQGSLVPLPLQIVPTLNNYFIDGTNTLRLFGTGLQEGSASSSVTYNFAGGTLSDTSSNGGPDICNPIPGSDNNAVYLPSEPVHGFGNVSTTTAGGTSAPLPLNELQPGVGLIRSLAMNPASPTQVWVADNGNPAALHLLDTTTGQQIRSIAITKVSNATSALGNTTFFGGMQVVPVSFTLRSTPVAAGSLLVFYGPSNPDYVVALNAITGNAIANLPLLSDYQATSGVYDPVTGDLFLVDHHSGSRIVGIYATTGGGHTAGDEDPAHTFAAPFSSGDSGLALDPSGDGTLWFGSDQSGVIVQMSNTGTLLRQFTIGAQAPGNIGLSGLVFDASGNLLLGSNQGAVLKLATSPIMRLNVTQNGTQVRVSWPINFIGVTLETNSNLTLPAGWTAVPGTPGVSGANFFRDFNPTTSELFFRLRSQ